MKKSDKAKNLLRAFIREEVKKIVTEEVNKSMAKILVEVMQGRNGSVNSALPTNSYTKNDKINEALNESAGDLAKAGPRSFMSEEIYTGGLFDKIGNPEEAYSNTNEEFSIDNSSKLNMMKSIVSKGPPAQQSSVLDGVNPLSGVLKKDFRSMIKKMDKIKEKGGAGFFNLSSIPMSTAEEMAMPIPE